VTPSLVVRGAAKAMDFWKEAFGAKERMRMPAPFGGDAIWHGELTVGNSIIFCNDEMPGPGWAKAHAAGSPPTSTLWVYVDGADALFDRAVKAGCKVLSPMTDMFWGDRTGVLADPFGVVWTLAQHVKDVSEEDAAKAGEEFARSMQQQGGPPA
jgi:uncharacterized glyoxalase superfamily protein PhnB